MNITETETLAALVKQLGLSSTVPVDLRLHATGPLKPGNSIYIEPGAYFNEGLAKFTIRRTLETSGPVTMSVFRHFEGERIEVFTTSIPGDRLEQVTFNNGSSLSEVIVPRETDIWELFVQAVEGETIPEGTAMQLILTPGRMD